MPKTVASECAVVRPAPYVPLRGLRLRLDVCSTVLKQKLARDIKRFGGVVDKKAFDEVVTDDPTTPSNRVKRHIQDEMIRPCSVKSVVTQIEEFDEYNQTFQTKPVVEITHRNTVFPVRFTGFTPLGRRMPTLSQIKTTEYEDNTMDDVIAVSYNHSQPAFDDTVVRLQLYKRKDNFLYTVHFFESSLFALCHNRLMSHFQTEFPSEAEAHAFFQKERHALEQRPHCKIVASQV